MLILASKSPRRQELLKVITEDFLCIPADTEEIIPEEFEPEEVPEYLAVQKALAVANSVKVKRLNVPATVIGCDTVVIIDGKILGKPADKSDAAEMLRTLSGRTHTVVTGVAICKNGKTSSFSDISRCTFYPLTEKEIEEYIETGEPMDKAGAYGIQGKGSLLVKEIQGDFYNIMGLPIAKLYRFLK